MKFIYQLTCVSFLSVINFLCTLFIISFLSISVIHELSFSFIGFFIFKNTCLSSILFITSSFKFLLLAIELIIYQFIIFVCYQFELQLLNFSFIFIYAFISEFHLSVLSVFVRQFQFIILVISFSVLCYNEFNFCQ